MDLKQEENVGTMKVLERHAFNLNSLETYLKNNVENYKGPLSAEEFRGGQSNPTYLIKTPR